MAVGDVVSPHCSYCGIELIPEINWAMCDVKTNHKRCKACSNQKCREWYKNCDKAAFREKKRNYHRKNIISTTNRRIFARKRPHSGQCELCGRNYTKWMNYHHWDDSNPALGIWLCRTCHVTVHHLQKHPNFLELYQKIKREVEDGRR